MPQTTMSPSSIIKQSLLETQTIYGLRGFLTDKAQEIGLGFSETYESIMALTEEDHSAINSRLENVDKKERLFAIDPEQSIIVDKSKLASDEVQALEQRLENQRDDNRKLSLVTSA